MHLLALHLLDCPRKLLVQNQRRAKRMHSAETENLSLRTPFPPERVRLALDAVNAWRHAKNFGRVLTLTPLSVFFDPKSYEGEAKSTVFTGIIAIAIVRNSMDSPLVAAIVEPSEQSTSDFLRREGVPVFPGKLTDVSAIAKFLDGVDLRNTKPKRPNENRPTDRRERWLLNSLMIATGSALRPAAKKLCINNPDLKQAMAEAQADWLERYEVFHEVSLGRLITLNKSRHNALLKFPCDALVCQRSGRPILVVEVDGGGHEKDKQREKDNWRDSQLQAAGLAVLRVSYRSWGVPASTTKNGVESIDEKRRSYILAEVIVFVVQTIMDHYEIDRQWHDRRTAAWIDFAKIIKRQIKDLQISEARILSAGERAALVSSALDKWIPILTEELSIDRALDRIDAMEEYHKSLARASTPFQAGSIDVRDGDNHEVYAVGVRARDGAKLRTPSLVLSLRLPSQHVTETVDLSLITRDAALHLLRLGENNDLMLDNA